MANNKDFEDARLFLYFVRNVREKPDRFSSRTLAHMISDSIQNSDDKYKCIYCGCEYVYRRSLISHLKRLHNIKNVE